VAWTLAFSGSRRHRRSAGSTWTVRRSWNCGPGFCRTHLAIAARIPELRDMGRILRFEF
jgi:hypothetical protein